MIEGLDSGEWLKLELIFAIEKWVRYEEEMSSAVGREVEVVSMASSGHH